MFHWFVYATCFSGFIAEFRYDPALNPIWLTRSSVQQMRIDESMRVKIDFCIDESDDGPIGPWRHRRTWRLQKEGTDSEHSFDFISCGSKCSLATSSIVCTEHLHSCAFSLTFSEAKHLEQNDNKCFKHCLSMAPELDYASVIVR